VIASNMPFLRERSILDMVLYATSNPIVYFTLVQDRCTYVRTSLPPTTNPSSRYSWQVSMDSGPGAGPPQKHREYKLLAFEMGKDVRTA
jgi:hypothetical protein